MPPNNEPTINEEMQGQLTPINIRRKLPVRRSSELKKLHDSTIIYIPTDGNPVNDMVNTGRIEVSYGKLLKCKNIQQGLALERCEKLKIVSISYLSFEWFLTSNVYFYMVGIK
jgi:hypothetical protein